jgi:hypothetical protein
MNTKPFEELVTLKVTGGQTKNSERNGNAESDFIENE